MCQDQPCLLRDGTVTLDFRQLKQRLLPALKRAASDGKRRAQEFRQRVVQSRQYRFLRDRALQYSYLCRLHRPIGIYLLLWPALTALWIAADGRPNLLVLFVFVAGTILMRSAGCAINDFADRNIDQHVRRTRERPIVSGHVRPAEALGVFVVLSLAAFGLVLLTNRLTIQLAVGGALLAATYPFAKRYTYMPQVVLGAAFAWSVPMAFAAQTGTIAMPAWLLYTATLLWTTAYDTTYAMVDRADDLKIGVKSTAILFGEADVALVMFLHALSLLALFLLGRQLHFSGFYFAGWLFAVALTAWQYLLIRGRAEEKCFAAFLHNQYIGMAIFTGVFAHYVYALFFPG